MRLDLHNHTLLQSLPPKKNRELILEILDLYELDAIAITNLHSIDDALNLSQECPGLIITGAEYKVAGEEGSSVQVVALDLNEELHKLLMKARFRGIACFTNILKEKHIPYYLSHIGSGIPMKHPDAAKFLEDFLAFFDAMEVLNPLSLQKNSFALGLAMYYGLAPVGGSGALILEGNKRAYTQASEAQNLSDFFSAFLKKNVKAGIANTVSESKISPSVWRISQDLYQKEIQKIWHSELGLSMHTTKGDILQSVLQSLLKPALDATQQIFHLYQTKSLEENFSSFQSKFIDYLKDKETKRIFSLSIDKEEKKKLWLDSISHIHSAFFV